MAQTAFSGRSLGEAQDILLDMVQDPDCLVVGTFSGAMSVAKMGLLICDMIDWGWLDIIISTGALMAHGLVESIGLVHYKNPPHQTDSRLYALGYNRIYDTLEMEKNLNDVENIIAQVLDRLDPREPLGSEIFCRQVGRYLSEITDQPGILKNAYQKGVPVFIPAFTDSELGLDLATWMVKKTLSDRPGLDLAQGLVELCPLLQPLFGPGRIYPAYSPGQKSGHLYYRRRGSPELGPTGRPFCGDPPIPFRPNLAPEAFFPRDPHLSGTGPLGGPERLHLLGRSFLGEVHSSGRRRPLRGNLL